ncbi:MAG TPA: mechanosensitive ion channel family protein [Acidimicrobiales bacterium]|jgi:small conductance mechanosensitive channel|nr:mechanosensitive ion channel family protein [Acidimicrobiales bacterium]
MTIHLVATLQPLVGAVDEGGGWLYSLLIKFGVAHGTARTVVDLIVRPVSIALVIIVALIAARYGSKAIRRLLERVGDQAASRSGSRRAGARVTTMGGVVANVWRFFVFVVAVAVILGQLGVDLAPLLASATIIGATLGFGAQLIVRDYFSGFLLTIEDQFAVGDTITVDSITGIVEDVTMRVTRVRSLDGSICFVPNGDIRLLANASRGWARAVVDLTLPGSAAVDLEQVRQLVADAAHRVAQRPDFVDHCTEPPVLVGFVAADATTLTLRVTLHTVPSQRDALTRALREEAIVALAQSEHWPAAADQALPPAST